MPLWLWLLLIVGIVVVCTGAVIREKKRIIVLDDKVNKIKAEQKNKSDEV
jgi:hypothetical protein